METTTQPPLIGTVEPENNGLLATIEESSVQKVFTTPGGLNPIIEAIEQAVKAFKPDLRTKKGREEIASFAYKVARTKTYLDGHGKTLAAKLKELPKLIDANRKSMWERLEALQAEARKPLDDWEAEQERLEAEKKAQEAAEALEKEILFSHEIGILLNAEFDRQQEEKRRQEEEAQIQREEALKREAEERAEVLRMQIQAETARQAQREKEEAERRIQEAEAQAQAAIEQAQRDKENAERRAREAEEREAQRLKESQEREERARVESAAREERARFKAINDEKIRRDEEERLANAAEAKRKANNAHRQKINTEALEDLMKIGLSQDVAKLVIIGIVRGEIRNITVNY
jgi:hypothetical protein